MKQSLKVVLLILIILVLVGCEEQETYEKELTFLEKSTDYLKNGGMVAIFESEKDEEYYYIKLSNWEYDHLNLEENENLMFETRELSMIDSFDYNVGSSSKVKEEIYYNEEFKALRPANKYTKTK